MGKMKNSVKIRCYVSEIVFDLDNKTIDVYGKRNKKGIIWGVQESGVR